MEPVCQNSALGTPATPLVAAAQLKKLPRTRTLTLDNIVFCCALALIPFDNLFFAPSRGWATIAPILFFLYVVLNLPALFKVKMNRGLLVALSVVLAASTLGIVRYGLIADAAVDVVRSMVLGLSFFVALIIRYQVKKENFDRDARVLFCAYVVSFVYGIVWLLVDNYAQNLIGAFELLEKRYYEGRLAFTFTEPAMISLHVFGVMLPFTWFMKDRRLARRMAYLAVGFLILCVACNSSVRCVADLGVFVALLLLWGIFNDTRHKMKYVLLIAVCVVVALIVIASSARIQRILFGGYSADGSAATRMFRLQAVTIGLLEDPLQALFGWGPGNLIIPFQVGYPEMRAAYTHYYTVEVDDMGVATSMETLMCMPLRLIAEFGFLPLLVGTILLFVLAYRRKISVFTVIMTLWLYVQYDSYAFYTIWLFLYLLYASGRGETVHSYFGLVVSLFSRKKGEQKWFAAVASGPVARDRSFK